MQGRIAFALHPQSNSVLSVQTRSKENTATADALPEPFDSFHFNLSGGHTFEVEKNRQDVQKSKAGFVMESFPKHGNHAGIATVKMVEKKHRNQRHPHRHGECLIGKAIALPQDVGGSQAVFFERQGAPTYHPTRRRS
jgi:hypothetical protein